MLESTSVTLNGPRSRRPVAVAAVAVAVGAFGLVAGAPAPALATAPDDCWDVPADVDGGGPDVVIGLPSYDLPGKPDAGVLVVYSNVGAEGASDPRAPYARTIVTANDVVGLGAEAGARFGAAVQLWGDSGDFDDPDDCSDLLVGAPGATVDGKFAAGAVYRVQGTPEGPVVLLETIDEDSLGLGAEAGARFGAAVAAETLTTLAVGAPGRDVEGAADAGRVVRIDQVGTELEEPPVVIEQGGLAGGAAEPRDHFGAVLEVLMTGGGAIVVVGIPDEDVAGEIDAGAVTALPYEAAPSTITQNSPDAGNRAEAGDAFGTAVQGWWTFTEETGLTLVLAVGVPGEDADGARDTGAVSYARMDVEPADVATDPWTFGPLTGDDRVVTQDSPRVAGRSEAGDAFGSAVVAGELGYDSGRTRLAVGAPGEDVAGAADAGAVVVTSVAPLGAPVAGPVPSKVWSQDGATPGSAEAGDRFGQALALTLLSTEEDDDDSVWSLLLATAPGEDAGPVANSGGAVLGPVRGGTHDVALRPPVPQRGAGLGMAPFASRAD